MRQMLGHQSAMKQQINSHLLSHITNATTTLLDLVPSLKKTLLPSSACSLACMLKHSYSCYPAWNIERYLLHNTRIHSMNNWANSWSLANMCMNGFTEDRELHSLTLYAVAAVHQQHHRPTLNTTATARSWSACYLLCDTIRFEQLLWGRKKGTNFLLCTSL